MQYIWSDRLLNKLVEHPLFQQIPADRLDLLLRWLGVSLQRFRPGAKITEQGKPCPALYLWYRGEAVQPWTSDVTGVGERDHLPLFSIEEGSVVGLFSALNGTKGQERGRWMETLVAKTEVELLQLPLQALRTRQAPEGELSGYMQSFLMNLSLYSLHQAEIIRRRQVILPLLSMRAKLSKLLLFVAEEEGTLQFRLPLRREEMATYLCVSRTSLSRELALMQREGWISYRLNRYRLLQPEALRQAAQHRGRSPWNLNCDKI